MADFGRRAINLVARSRCQTPGKEVRSMMIYPTRYQAEKARRKGEEVVVKVTGGYAVMTYRDYQIWKNQK